MNSIRQIVTETTKPAKPAKDQLHDLVIVMDTSGLAYPQSLKAFRRRYLLHIIEKHEGNICIAAADLGMHRNTLTRQLAELKIDARPFRPMERRRVASARYEEIRRSIG